METVAEVMKALEKKGNAGTRKIYAKHGAPESMFGVKVGDMKPIAKKIKGKQDLACELYQTGNVDAMYLAGMVADGSQMKPRQLEQWMKSASFYWLSEYGVPGVVCEHEAAVELALKWIPSKKESVAAGGWCVYSGVVATREDTEIDLEEVKGLLKAIETEIDTVPNRVRYSMNRFVIAVGNYVKPLLKQAKQTARKIGVVKCDLGDTSCKVPPASEYIEKIEKLGAVGKKRKTVKC